MELLINNKGPISANTAMKIKKICERGRANVSKSIVTLIIIALIWIRANVIISLLVLAAMLCLAAIYRVRAISNVRKLVYAMDGTKMIFGDNEITTAKRTYSYNDVKYIATADGFLVVFLGIYRLVVKITDENKDDILAIVKLLKSKMYRLEENIVISNPNQIKFGVKVKVWNERTSFAELATGFIVNVLLFSLIYLVFNVTFRILLASVIFILIVFALLYGLRMILAVITTKRYLGIDILFTDSHISWLNKKLDYSLISRIVIRKNHVTIEAGKQVISMFCSEENMSRIARVCEILKLKCSNNTLWNDIAFNKKQNKKNIIAYAVICAVLCLYSVVGILSYPTKLSAYEKSFKEKYNITLNVLEDDETIGDYDMKDAKNRIVIIDAIEKMDNTLSKFPKEFWDEVSKMSNIVFVVCGDIEGETDIRENINGLTVNNLIQINVYIDYDGTDIESTVAHEMFHVMRQLMSIRNIFNQDEDGDQEQWMVYNPSGFVYGTNSSKYDEAFVTDYAKTNISEDMAETFKYLVSSDDKLPAKYKNEAIKKKSVYILKWIEENFDSITENAYWYKWFE